MPRYISIYIEHKKRIKFSEKQLRNRRLKEYLHQTLPSPQIHKFKNYCQLTGAGKSVYSQFALSRHSLRKHLNFGLIPGSNAVQLVMFLSSPQIIPLQKVAKYSYAQLILYGLNYSFKKIRNRKILLNLHYSYVFGFKLPPTIIGRVYKRRFVIFGEKLFLLQFIKELVQLRKGNIYTGKGFRLRTLPYRVKPGKVKRR